MKLADLPQEWDVIVVGGGITGAGIFRQSVHMGYKTLLVEQKDFAWGTSSRSSKLVHGGLRYLKEGKIGLVRDSVTERQALMRELPGLVEPLAFLVPDYRGKFPPAAMLKAGLAVYDGLGRQWQHQWLEQNEFIMRAPHLNREGLQGGARFMDAQVDDARLVLRTLFDGQDEGGSLLNYTTASEPSWDGKRASLELSRGDEKCTVSGRVIFNATGAWADKLQTDSPHQLRPLRGSHITFEAWRLPIPCAYSFTHHKDRRPMFVIPWEGAVFCGTTDLDHPDPLGAEPRISSEEMDYLLDGMDVALPHLGLTHSDLLGTWAGVRPVITSGANVDPSKETRDHAIWVKDGVVSMTGGKLTTFRLMAQEALQEAAQFLDSPSRDDLFRYRSASGDMDRRLSGRHGLRTEQIEGSDWEAEVSWAARREMVVHLEDLLLRRLRWGLVLPRGGADRLGRVKELAQEPLGWDDARWEEEKAAYLKLWDEAYSVPR